MAGGWFLFMQRFISAQLIGFGVKIAPFLEDGWVVVCGSYRVNSGVAIPYDKPLAAGETPTKPRTTTIASCFIEKDNLEPTA